MCGINGFFSSKYDGLEIIQKTNLSLKHRGPDSEGIYNANNGLYLGIFLSIYTAVCYAVDLNLFTNTWLGIAILFTIIGFCVYSSIKSKKILEGFISFKDADI